MPFTLSHPAAVVPFSNKKLNLSALIIGSMIPDFDNFFPYLPIIFNPHMLHGLFTFCIPFGFLLWIIFQKVIKKPVLSFFPTSHQLRLANLLEDYKFTSLGSLGWVLFSIWLGGLTHIILDSFTHGYGIFVHIIPFLRVGLFTIGVKPIQVYMALQLILSILGILLLMIWYWRWYQRTSKLELLPTPYLTNPIRWVFLEIFLFIAIIGGTIITFQLVGFPSSLRDLYQFVRDLFIGTMGFLLVQIFLFCILFWGWQKTRHI